MGKKRREVPFDPTFGVGMTGTPISDASISHSLGDVVRDCVNLLDEEDRTVLEMYFWERLTYAQISERLLGFEDGQVRGRQDAFYRVQRAKARLQKLLDEEGIDDAYFG